MLKCPVTDAAKHAISDGDQVKLTSSTGTVAVKARNFTADVKKAFFSHHTISRMRQSVQSGPVQL
jgi:formylmethanofuran dehydrogenase subunit D